MPIAYFEARPAFLGETFALVVTVPGSVSIAGWVLDAKLYAPGGADTGLTIAANVLDAVARTIQVAGSIPSSGAGDYVLTVRRTDDGSNLVVSHGVIEVKDPKVF